MNDVEIATKLTEHENRIKVNEHRVADLETKTDKLEALTLSVQELALSVKQMAKDQAEAREEQQDMAKRLLEVEQAPAKAKAKRHDEIMSLILSCVISALFGAFVAYLGLNV